MGSIKDALQKAGFKQTNSENERARNDKFKGNSKSNKFQKQRNFCEVCSCIYPDVERYNHRNPIIHGTKWICCLCADKNEIHDNCRQTAQSDFSKKNVFRRNYGPTLKIEKNIVKK